jgi:hypothetical protein
MCPNCKKYTTCGCSSCKERRGSLETDEIWNEETITCPFCGETTSFDYWEAFAIKQQLKEERYGQ